MTRRKPSPRELRILFVSGPSLDRLGKRQPEIYGKATLADIDRTLTQRAEELSGPGLVVRFEHTQSNNEGEIVGWIGDAKERGFQGIVLNAAAYTHTSIAILDAILGAEIPCVEVHLSNPEAREPFRHTSVIARGVIGKVCGFGPRSYLLGFDAIVGYLEERMPLRLL